MNGERGYVWLGRLGSAVADVFVPRRCIHCKALLTTPFGGDAPGSAGRPGGGEWPGGAAPHFSGLCGACRHVLHACEIPVTEMPFHIDAWPLAVRWVFSDGSPIRSVHHAFKYEGRPELADFLATSLMAALRRLAAMDDLQQGVVVPVPSHRLRILERGYCQAAVLAGRAARHLGCRAAPGALARREHAGSQTRLHAHQRLANVHQAFQVRSVPDGDPIILIDDVVTTGATLHACATRLQHAVNTGMPTASRPTILLAAPAIRPPLPLGRILRAC